MQGQYVVADETVMMMPFGKIILRCGPKNVDLSRLGSRGGLPYLAGHDHQMPLGRWQKMEAKNRQVIGTAEVVETDRNMAFIQEIKAGLVQGCSPGFLLDYNDIQALDDPEDPDNFIAVVNSWSVYEASSTSTPVNKNAGLLPF